MGRLGIAALLAAALLSPAAAQVPGAPPDGLAPAAVLLDSCVAAAQRREKDHAEAAARRAEAMFAELAKALPGNPEPLVGQARAISQCRLPFADGLRAGGLYRRSTELLERALALDSTHWTARYTLAVNHYRAPRFLGVTGEAIRQFEILLRQQGDAAAFPEQARPYTYLGDLYQREGRLEDAERIWRRGATLFPDDSGLRRRLEGPAR